MRIRKRASLPSQKLKILCSGWDLHCQVNIYFFLLVLKPFKKKSGWTFLIILFTGGIKDLKIYADLALLSVEGDEHVGRVTHLHSAAIGYSSMIFGDINGEVEMINTWKVVWQNLEKDQFLPKKLVTI